MITIQLISCRITTEKENLKIVFWGPEFERPNRYRGCFLIC